MNRTRAPSNSQKSSPGSARSDALCRGSHRTCSPAASRAEIEHFAQASPAGLIVVDEAYVEFTDDPDATTCLPLVASGRVAVLRTFSKIHGLAGLRVGYLTADPGIITTPGRPPTESCRRTCRITMIRHVVLLGVLGAGAYGGRQRGDGFQLRLVLERETTLANRKSRIMRRRVATHNVRANAPVTRFRVLADSEPSPSQ